MAITPRTLGIMLAAATMLGAAIPATAQATRPSATEPVADPDEESPAAAPVEDEDAAESTPEIETATFGAGCFWSTEAVFERYKGVVSVVSGFSGGFVPSPSYQQVCTGETGHAEVVQVAYDPSLISYEDLLNIYFHAHDPTTPNRQGDDFGPQYRSVIFYHNEEQRRAALAMYRELTARRAFRAPIVTQLVPFEGFYPAEAYHQDYFRHHRRSVYTMSYILPKLRKMSKLKLTGSRAEGERDGEGR